jgi:pseudouridine-5'-phosphate glycosidase
LITEIPEVAAALAEGRPVVALESTIITHGMPYPQNLETARAVEDAVRAAGATPATIAVMGGRLHVGLTGGAEDLAQARDVQSSAARIWPLCLATGGTGATTVAATMIAPIWRGSRSSPRAASAGCIAARRRASTSPPTCASWRKRP